MNRKEQWIKKLQAHPLWQQWQAWRHPFMTCFFLDGRLWAADLKGRRFLRRSSAPVEKVTEENITAAFRELQEKGMKRKDMLLLVNFPDLRMENRKYPAMTEEEMEETMYWEEDRLFRTEEPMAVGYEVTSHTPAGWEVHVEAVKKGTLSLWEKSALSAGVRIGKVLPVTAIPLSPLPHFILYGRRRSAILIFRTGKLLRSRILKKDEEGKMSLFMGRCLSNFHMEKAGCFFIPLADCREEERIFWKERVKKEIEGTDSLPAGAVTMEETPFSGSATAWQAMEPLWKGMDHGHLTLTLTEKAPPFISPENRTLRAAQALCLLGMGFFLYSGGQFIAASSHLEDLRQEGEALAPQKERMVQARQERAEEREILDLLQKLEKRDGKWEEKLVSLGESLPPGIVISSIRQEGDILHIKGTAQSPEQVTLLRNSFSASWGKPLQNGKRQVNPVTRLVDFTISLKGGAHGLEKPQK